MTLLLPREFQTRIEAQARAAFPGECCGLIEGRRDNNMTNVLALHPARNIASRRDRFEIHPEDHFAALKEARADGQAIIGCYHSHPNGMAKPSAADRTGAGEEDFLWLIAALAKADGPVTLAAYCYSAADFRSVDMIAEVGTDLVTSSGKSLS